jgi:hypothetical protein
MGRWDQKKPVITFDLDIAGYVLLAIGVGIVVLAVGSEISGYILLVKGLSSKGVFFLPGLPIQIFFVTAGLVVGLFGIILLLINGGYIKLKKLKYGDDKFYADEDGEWSH